MHIWEKILCLPYIFIMLEFNLYLLHPKQLEDLMYLFYIIFHILPLQLLDLMVILVLVLSVLLRILLHQLGSLLNNLTLVINTLVGHTTIIHYMSLILEELPISGINLLMDLKLELTKNNHHLWVKMLPIINNLLGFTTNLNRPLVLLGYPYLINIRITHNPTDNFHF